MTKQKFKLQKSKPSAIKPTFYVKQELGTEPIKQKTTYYKGLREINRIVEDLGVPKQTNETAKEIFRRYSNSGKMQGRKTEDVAAGTVYVAARITNIPRSLDEISKKSQVPKLRISKAAKSIARSQKLAVAPTPAPQLVAGAASKLKLTPTQTSDSIRLANNAYKLKKAPDSSPTSVVGAAIWLKSDKTQKEVAKAVGISDSTLRKTAKRIK